MQDNEQVVEGAVETAPSTAAKPEQSRNGNANGRSFNKNDNRNDSNRPRKNSRDDRPKREVDEFEKRMIELSNVQKTVKGGRILSFRALCVVGDKKGRVGIGIGKARETINAIEKGFVDAKKNMITVPMVGTTIPHEASAKFGAALVKLMPAKQGSGVIAGGAARAVLELAGIKDVTSKLYGSRNKINSGRATFEALKSLRTKEQVAAIRGKTVEEL